MEKEGDKRMRQKPAGMTLVFSLWPKIKFSIRILIDSCKPVDIGKAFNVVSEKLQVSREEIEWKVIPW